MNLFSQLAKNFSELELRERVLAVAVGCVVLALGGNLLLLKPVQLEIDRSQSMDRAHKEEIAKAMRDLADVDVKLSLGVDPLQKERATRDEFLRKIAEADAFFTQHDATGTQVDSLVRSLLDESPGVVLVSLKTLPGQVFYSPPPPPAPKAADQAIEGIAKLIPLGARPEPVIAKPIALQKTIYRHGFEVSVKGRYPQLVSYMEKLQKFPKRVFWSEARLTVSPYPVTVLTFVIYTLSDQPVAQLG